MCFEVSQQGETDAPQRDSHDDRDNELSQISLAGGLCVAGGHKSLHTGLVSASRADVPGERYKDGTDHGYPCFGVEAVQRLSVPVVLPGCGEPTKAPKIDRHHDDDQQSATEQQNRLQEVGDHDCLQPPQRRVDHGDKSGHQHDQRYPLLGIGIADSQHDCYGCGSQID